MRISRIYKIRKNSAHLIRFLVVLYDFVPNSKHFLRIEKLLKKENVWQSEAGENLTAPLFGETNNTRNIYNKIFLNGYNLGFKIEKKNSRRKWNKKQNIATFIKTQSLKQLFTTHTLVMYLNQCIASLWQKYQAEDSVWTIDLLIELNSNISK